VQTVKLEKLQRQNSTKEWALAKRFSSSTLFDLDESDVDVHDPEKEERTEKTLDKLQTVLRRLWHEKSTAFRELQSIATTLMRRITAINMMVKATPYLLNIDRNKMVSLNPNLLSSARRAEEDAFKKHCLDMHAKYIKSHNNLMHLKTRLETEQRRYAEMIFCERMLHEFYYYRYYRGLSADAKTFWKDVLDPLVRERDSLEDGLSVVRGLLDEKFVRLDDSRRSLERNADMIVLIDITEWLEYIEEKGVPGWQRHTKTMSSVTQKTQPSLVEKFALACQDLSYLAASANAKITAKIDHNQLSDYGQLSEQLTQAQRALKELHRVVTSVKEAVDSTIEDNIPATLRAKRDKILVLREEKQRLENILFIGVVEEYQDEEGNTQTRRVKRSRKILENIFCVQIIFRR